MKRLFFLLFLCVSYRTLTAQDRHLFLVHTSDAHSCVEPLSPNITDSLQADKGGFLRRVSLVKSLRREHDGLLLLDCGDFSQGSVYYNLFHGEVEVKLMNEMGYDACTIGNHEFDSGLENMARLFRMAQFPVVCCNYDFTGTPCEGLVKSYLIIERAGVRVGIFGVSPRMEGLVQKRNYQGVSYTTPIEAAQPVVDILRGQEHCDIVVCLSHLGLGESEERDLGFIRGTRGIDVVLGGHTHSYLEHPRYVQDMDGHEVVLDHMGKNARFVGTVDLTL